MNIRIWLCTVVLCALTLSGANARDRVRISSIEVVGGSQPVIYVLDNANDELVVVDDKGSLIRRISLALADGKNSQTWGLVAAPSNLGDVFVIGNLPGVRVVSSDGTVRPYITSLGSYTDRLPGIDPAGVFYYPDKETNKVKVYNLHAGAELQSAVKISEQETLDVNTPKPLQIDRDQPELVLDGNVSGMAHLGRPSRIEVPSTECVWVCDQSYVYTVFRWKAQHSGLEFAAKVKAPDKGNRSFTNVTGIRCDAKGDTYIACCDMKSILRFDRNFKVVKTIPTGCRSYGLAVDANGQLYIGDDYRGGPDGRTPEIKVLDSEGRQLRTIQLPVVMPQ